MVDALKISSSLPQVQPAALVLLGMLTLGAAGCGPSPVAVQGRVTLDDRPLDEAVILFVPLDEGRKKTGTEIVDGQYHLPREDGLLPGKYRVEIADNPPLDGVHSAGHGQQAATSAAPQRRRPFPYRYTHDSPFSVEVEPSSDDPLRFDFELTTKPESG